MKIHLHTFYITLLVLLNTVPVGAQKPIKYLPRALKNASQIPHILNPKLPLAAQTQFALPVVKPPVDLDSPLQKATATALKTVPPISVFSPNLTKPEEIAPQLPLPDSCPERFVGFVRWLDQLLPNHFAANNTNTVQALSAIHDAVIHYNLLPDADKSRINWLVISLNKMRPYIKLLPNGNLQRLVYGLPLPEGELPQADFFYLDRKQNGIRNPFFRYGKNKLRWPKSFRVLQDKNNPGHIWALLFFESFSAQTTQEELTTLLKELVPYGYHIRMGIHELGIMKENRQKFREGNLHLHIETDQPNTQFAFPTHISMELGLRVQPYAGITDPSTHAVIIPNSDQTIARNYLTLFEPFLDSQARAALQAIIAKQP